MHGGHFFPLDIEQVTLNALRGILTNSRIETACWVAGYTFRKRKLTPILTVLHMVLAALWSEESLQASADLTWDSIAAAFPESPTKQPSRGSFCKARKRLPMAVWTHLHHAIASAVNTLSRPWSCWRGHRVVLVDGTCLSMSDTPELHEAFGRQHGRHGESRYPLLRMVAVSLANTMTVLDYAFGSYRTGETALLRRLFDSLSPGDLIVADRHFAGANLYCEYQRAGVEFLTRAHQRLNIGRLKVVEWLGENDFVARMAVNKTYRRKDPSLPTFIEVRLVGVKVSGRKSPRLKPIWLVTSLLDPTRYPAAELVELYGRRWGIETLFGQLKINLHADVLRSQAVDGVQKELTARIIALNCVHGLILQAAKTHHVDPMRVSFSGTVRAILTFSPHFATAPPWRLRSLEQALLRTIAHRLVPYRPGRIEPRAVTRERKHYPHLNTTRKLWRTQWKAA